ncbi:WRKY family transcription factor [Tanacetum coccineum]
MYSTISPKLVDMVIDDNTTAREVWKRLKDIFHDNKDVRIIRLDYEIRNMNIGNLFVTDYFQVIKSKADHLANLGSNASNLSLVTYVISGFRSRFPEIARIIIHRETLPTFDNVRFMVLLKECDMASHNNVISSYQNTSSSPTVLVATNLSNLNPMMANSGIEQCRKHTKIPFYSSESNVASVFEIIHSDLWTSPLPSESDDIILTASSTPLLQRIIALLHSEFAMTDLGSLNYFLSVFAQRLASGMFLSQSKFVKKILERARMQNCNPYKTPVDTDSKLGLDDDPVTDPTLYRSLAGALQCLTFTRSDLSYAV